MLSTSPELHARRHVGVRQITSYLHEGHSLAGKMCVKCIIGEKQPKNSVKYQEGEV